jgi:hypothetical protein
VVSVALDTSEGRAYIHGMAITPNEGGRVMGIHWYRYGRGSGENRASHAGDLWRILKTAPDVYAVERASAYDDSTGLELPAAWERVGTFSKFGEAKAAVQAVAA